MSDREIYGPDFFRDYLPTATSSAAAVTPFLIEYLPGISSVVDFGCGLGTWLREFSRAGIEIVGVDGPHIDTDLLQIPMESFVAMDLRQPALARERRFDLALCLEVAEHLPEASGPALVETLARSADIVVFGAAIPPQDDAVGGTGHINLHWQSYWANLFAEQGLFPDDRLRSEFWSSHPRVTYHYSQNALIYRRSPTVHGPLDVVHPELAGLLRFRSPTLGQLARDVPALVRASFASRSGRFSARRRRG